VQKEMKVIISIFLFVCVGCIFSLGIVVRLATPEVWAMADKSLTLRQVQVDENGFIMIKGDGINSFGQVQSINVECDPEKKRIIVSRYLIRWNPFTKITINNQWPVFYPLDWLEPGIYSVVYQTENGEAIAGTVEVPCIPAGNRGQAIIHD
jgi:hypothetical protein